ncbi:hypothetical protein SAMN05421642_115137 [Rhodococcoides kyotonense]|uniref:Uncharacterized protein n=1 Tax=Rhodococcoides kyotonense TaxID=398843 RepID=A0A239M4Y8_9NOCA|nr:hypothetical protein SAMN05421642_115137 [Rhodococcus kyotonensis]
MSIPTAMCAARLLTCWPERILTTIASRYRIGSSGRRCHSRTSSSTESLILENRHAGDLGADRRGQVVFDVADGHPARVQRDDHVVETADPSGAYGIQPRNEGAVAIAWNRQGHVADLTGDGLFAESVAGVGDSACSGIVFVVAEVFGEFGFQSAFEDRFDHLLQKPALADDLQFAGVVLAITSSSAPEDRSVSNALVPESSPPSPLPSA